MTRSQTLWTRWLALLTATLALSVWSMRACIVPAPGAQASRNLPSAAEMARPPLTVAANAVLGDTVQWTSSTFAPGAVQPGERVKVTFEFKTLKPIDVAYQVFVHVEGAENPAERINADHEPSNGRMPTSEWEAGEVVRDEFTFVWPSNKPKQALNVYAGLWDPKSNRRMAISQRGSLSDDGTGRLLVARIPAAR